MSSFITIPNFSNMTRQQIFDTSARHLLSIPGPSVMENALTGYASCDYAGIGCAAAPFIREDERSSPVIKNRQWFSIVGLGLAPSEHLGLITELQRFHDDLALIVPAERGRASVSEIRAYWTTAKWRGAIGPVLRRLAKKYKLNEDAIDEMEKGV